MSSTRSNDESTVEAPDHTQSSELNRSHYLRLSCSPYCFKLESLLGHKLSLRGMMRLPSSANLQTSSLVLSLSDFKAPPFVNTKKR